MDTDTVKYTSQAVDTGHAFDDDWSGQTLKRSDGEAQEATVYTNIDPATPQKLKLGEDVSDTDAVWGCQWPPPQLCTCWIQAKMLIWKRQCLGQHTTGFPVRLRAPPTLIIAQLL